MKQFSKELGKVSITPKGIWDSNISNERLDIVYDRRNNQAYIAKQDVPIGVDIDNREYWQPLNVSGYADNNFINLTAENENGTITAYESLEEAVTTIFPINRRVGAILSFYNLNSYRLDRQAEFELWQFNSTDLANWENRDYWNNIYYNWNVFAGWYVDADSLENNVETPNVGQYAYVGSNLNDALLYQCRTNGVWTNTGIKVRNYISVVVSGNITIGDNGNWFNDGEDTGIPATPAVDEQLDNIIMQLQQHTTEINSIKEYNENLQDQITSNDNDITNLTAKHESLSTTVQGIAATGGASTATNVTYNNDASGLNAENAQDAIDEVGSKLNDLCDTFDGVASKNTTPKDGKVFYIGYQSGVYPNFDNVECKLNGLNILKRMYNGKFGNYFIDFGSPYAFQGNQAVNWGILDDYIFIHNNTSVTIKGKFNILILFPYAKRTNLTKEFSIDVPKDSVSIVYAEVINGKAEMFYCNIIAGSQETSFLKEIDNKNGLAVVPLFIIDRGSEDVIPLLMMATGLEDKENIGSYYNKASYAQKSDILPIKALIKTTFDKNFYGRIDDFHGEATIFPIAAHKNAGLIVRDSIANEDGFLHQIKATVNGNGVFSLRVGLLDQRNMFVERSRTNIFLSLGNNTINVLDKHILIKKGETVALSITDNSATCSLFYEKAQQSGEKTFLYSSWDGVFSELATDFGGIVIFGFNMVSVESAFAYAIDIEKTNETLNTIESKLNKQQYVYDADNNPYKLKVIDGELIPLPINYKKVLALGNSLTSHEKNEIIGYYGDESWAMASTNKVETTWTNYLERILKQKNVSASVTPFNIFDWETNPNNVDLDNLFSKVSDTDYDLIIFRAGENGNYVDTYQEGFDRLIRFLQNKYKRATIVVSEMFWHNSQKEAAFKKVANEHGLQYVYTGNINDRCLLGQMLMGIDNQFHPIVHNGVAAHCTDVCYCKYGNILANALGYDEIQNELHTVSISTNKEYSINNTIQVYNGYVSILTYEDSVPTITGVDIQSISLKSANWINMPDKVPTYVSVFKMPNSDVNITIS